jgi:arginine decarboxylase
MANQTLKQESFQNGKISGLLIGNRIPKDYFLTSGCGQSDITVHAGSYHLALKAAGIEMANIMTYSSILPSIATQVEKPKKGEIVHGCVMESIIAAANGNKGERVSAGIIYGWLYDKTTGEKYGGLVCEHNGNYTLEELKDKLNLSLQELYVNGFDDQFYLKDIVVTTESFVPDKEYGTALVAICFTNYVFPILS